MTKEKIYPQDGEIWQGQNFSYYYILHGLVEREETNEKLVCYMALHNDYKIYVRSRKTFEKNKCKITNKKVYNDLCKTFRLESIKILANFNNNKCELPNEGEIWQNIKDNTLCKVITRENTILYKNSTGFHKQELSVFLKTFKKYNEPISVKSPANSDKIDLELPQVGEWWQNKQKGILCEITTVDKKEFPIIIGYMENADKMQLELEIFLKQFEKCYSNEELPKIGKVWYSREDGIPCTILQVNNTGVIQYEDCTGIYKIGIYTFLKLFKRLPEVGEWWKDKRFSTLCEIAVVDTTKRPITITFIEDSGISKLELKTFLKNFENTIKKKNKFVEPPANSNNKNQKPQQYPQDSEENEYRYISNKWLDSLAYGLTAGANKHPGETWRDIPAKEHAARALRHLNLYLAGDKKDKHLINASMRCMMAFETDKERKDNI